VPPDFTLAALASPNPDFAVPANSHLELRSMNAMAIFRGNATPLKFQAAHRAKLAKKGQ
jgi:hypothetical protein